MTFLASPPSHPCPLVYSLEVRQILFKFEVAVWGCTPDWIQDLCFMTMNYRRELECEVSWSGSKAAGPWSRFGGWGVWVWVYCSCLFFFLVWFYEGGCLASSLTSWSSGIRSLIWDGVGCASGSGYLTFPSPTRLQLERFSFISWPAFLHCLRNKSVCQTVTTTTPYPCRLSCPLSVESLFPDPWILNILPVILKAKSPYNRAWNPGEGGVGRELFAFLFYLVWDHII